MKEKDFIKKMLDNYIVKTLDIVNNGNILNNYTKKIYVGRFRIQRRRR
jgi:hypothetical protein